MNVQRDVVYLQRHKGPLFVDLYLPDSTAKALILFAHGGGFMKGERVTPATEQIARRLNDAGFAMGTVSYRLGGTLKDLPPEFGRPVRRNRKATARSGVTLRPRLFGAAFECARQDIGVAIKFARENIKRWPIKSDRVGLIGVSAGGIASLSLAYPPGNLPTPDRPDAVFAVSSAMVQPWRLKQAGPPSIMLNSVVDRIIGPENARQTQHLAETNDAAVDVLMCSRRGHNAPVSALLKDNDTAGRAYWDHMIDLFERALTGT